MRWSVHIRFGVGTLVVLGAIGFHGASAQELALAPSKPKVPGLGDAGSILNLALSPHGEQEKAVILRGGDARLQLAVTGQYSTGQSRDLTRQVIFDVSEPGIVRIDETGLATPMGDGTVTITAKAKSGVVGKTVVKVVDFGKVVPVNFPNQVVPIFTKLGCNSGGCHGKASGQNGFKLSLLGFYPDDDYEYLVKEGRGRRLFPAAPERSLLLRKVTNSAPHGGGHRMDVDSHEYRLLHRWIAQGMPYGNADDPVVERIEVLPSTRTMGREGEQQIRVVAHYSDGSTEDVTRVAKYEANNTEMAEITEEGLVTTLDLTGDVAVMVRYQGKVDVFRASIPLGITIDDLPPAKNFVDELVFSKLKTLGIPPSSVCDDSTFIRRASVDIAGRLPAPEEVLAFLADEDPAKRDKLVDRLVDSAGYADYFANKWSSVLRNKRRNDNQKRGTFAFHSWIRSSLYYNKPYDQFVREILAASGEVGQNPPVIWYREVKDSTQQVEDAAQLFLGLRIQCARCHHHPFEKWSQDDYYGFAAFFSRVGRKNGTQPDEQRIFHNRGAATAKNPRNGNTLKPTGLDAEPLELAADEDPRQALADWMSDPANPFFAHSLVNRYWKHFFDRGLVDPEDDMRVTNPASNPELLQSLATHFIESGFDLKNLVRTVCKSTAYQLSSEPNDYNLSDKQNYSRYYPKRLTAEVLYDALNQATNTTAGFGALPPGTRAVELPDQGVNNYFLTVFGRPQSDTACECERSQEANLAQSLHLLNSSEVQGKLSNANGRAAALAKEADASIEEKITELYFWVYSRPPVDDEIAIARAHIEKTENKQQAYEDILWALVNTKEFLFNH